MFVAQHKTPSRSFAARNVNTQGNYPAGHVHHRQAGYSDHAEPSGSCIDTGSRPRLVSPPWNAVPVSPVAD